MGCSNSSIGAVQVENLNWGETEKEVVEMPVKRRESCLLTSMYELKEEVMNFFLYCLKLCDFHDITAWTRWI